MKYLFLCIFLIACSGPDYTSEPPTEDQSTNQVICDPLNKEQRCCSSNDQCPNGITQFANCSKHVCNLETKFCEYIIVEDMQNKMCRISRYEGTCNQGICNLNKKK